MSALFDRISLSADATLCLAGQYNQLAFLTECYLIFFVRDKQCRLQYKIFFVNYNY